MFEKLTATALFIGFIVMSAGSSVAQDAGASDAGANLARGEQLFQFCTKCHGAQGGGNSAALAPGIAGMPAWYLEGQLQKFKSGVRGMHPDDTGGLRMYPMSQWLRTEADQEAVAAYIASLPPVEGPHELVEAGDPARGAGYYAVCSACHMADGSGNEAMGAPPLTGLSDWYLMTSIRKYKAGIRGSSPGDALGAAMIGMVATLPDEAAIRDLIAHINSLGK